MQHTVSDLTVSVEHAFDADARSVWHALTDRPLFEHTTNPIDTLECVDHERAPPTTRAPPDQGAPESRRAGDHSRSADRLLVEGETYVGEFDVTIDGAPHTFETYLTVQLSAYPRLVLAGGGDATNGAFDTHLIVALADVNDGTVVRMDAEMNVAGDVAAAGPESVRAGITRGIERYFAGVQRTITSTH